MRKGFTLTELIVVIALTVAVAGGGFLVLTRSRSSYDLKNAAAQITATLRQAQQNSLTNASSTGWGVRFDNTTSTSPRVSLFASSTYATSSVVTTYVLGASVQYTTSTIPASSTKDVVFARQTGYPTASTTLGISSRSTTSTYTISVSSVGVVRVTRSLERVLAAVLASLPLKLSS